jgi:hypothetical protein
MSAVNNTTGNYNTAYGYKSLHSNTTGKHNTAVGYHSLFSPTTSEYNTAIGENTLYSTTTGFQNTAVGNNSMYWNFNGSNNVAVGHRTLFQNSSGVDNTALGVLSLTRNTTGEANIAVGPYSMNSNISGRQNVGIGRSVLASNTWGSHNIAIGNLALFQNIGGCNSIALGNMALFFYTNNSPNGANVAVGNETLMNTTTGTFNTGVGTYALNSNGTGTNNTAIGYYADVLTANLQNANAIGMGALATASNQVRIGSNSVTSIGGYTGWTNVSDGRVKMNIKQDVPGLAFIKKLTPVTYNLDLSAAEKLMAYSPIVAEGSERPKHDEGLAEAKNQKQQIVYTGFVAQDVEKAAESLKYNFSGVDAPKHDRDLYGLRYAEFVVPLVKAVQELSAENEKKDAAIETLTGQLAELDRKMNSVLIQLSEMTGKSSSTPTLSGSSESNDRQTSFLDENFPNPTTTETTIRYYITPLAKKSEILMTDFNGRPLRRININTKGSGTTSIKTSELAKGTYFYSLIVDGTKADTKKIVVF